MGTVDNSLLAQAVGDPVQEPARENIQVMFIILDNNVIKCYT